VTEEKGKILEMVVANLHNDPNVKVDQNVQLSAMRNPKRTREIDILLTGFFAGYPTKIAIECKNYESVLDVTFIDAFIGKLEDVGIPLQHGIYVSTHGFSKAALERSKEVGITLLIYKGLTPDRLSEKINNAMQSVIYMLLEITKLTIQTNVEQTENPLQLWFLYNQEKKIQGSIPDLIWREWINGALPSKLGVYEIDVKIPDGWQLLVDGKPEAINYAKARIKIVGVVLTIPGKAIQQTLIDPVEKKIDRFKINMLFDTSKRKIPVTTLFNDKDIDIFLEQQPEPIKIMIGRYRLPRIKCYPLYWPISARVASELATLTSQCQVEGRKPSDDELSKIEGNDLSAFWDTMWEENPILKIIKP